MKKLTIKGPADIATAVPAVLGFAPENSIMMLVVKGPRQFHARVDLPDEDTPRTLAGLADVLIQPCKAHGAEQVILAGYGTTVDYVQRLATVFEVEGVQVALSGTVQVIGEDAVVRTMYDEYWTKVEQLASREEIREAITPRGHNTPTWAHNPIDRDDMYSRLTRDDSHKMLVLLTGELADSDPDAQETAHVAAATALCAWLAGDGATAWLAYDIGFNLMPEQGLLAYVSSVLTAATPPDQWDEDRKRVFA